MSREVFHAYFSFLALMLLTVCFTTGCGQFFEGVKYSEHFEQALRENPKSYIGKYFELRKVTADEGLDPRMPVFGAHDPEILLRIHNSAPALHDPKVQKMIEDEYLKPGLILNLNEGTNAYDSKAKLLLQIQDIQKTGDQILLKIKLLNKKYANTICWINSGILLVWGKEISSPYGNH